MLRDRRIILEGKKICFKIATLCYTINRLQPLIILVLSKKSNGVGEYSDNVLAMASHAQNREYEMWEIGLNVFSDPDYASMGGHRDHGNSWVLFCRSLAVSWHCPYDINFAKIRPFVDAQSMFAAIKARFGGNEATKKTQEGSVETTMSKPDFDTMGLDDLYNKFKIIEQKVKRSAGARNDDKNLAFITTSGASSTNNINTVNPEVEILRPQWLILPSMTISAASFSDATVLPFLSLNQKGSH
ncbi:hypothetical protein Tco_0023940 [Tanacetum coccineum]